VPHSVRAKEIAFSVFSFTPHDTQDGSCSCALDGPRGQPWCYMLREGVAVPTSRALAHSR
jgi:hypothetical protein